MVEHAAEIQRLRSGDDQLARATLAVIGEVFEVHDRATLSDAYLAGLLARNDLWLYAATEQGEPVGGMTVHTLPLTSAEASELMIYDIAVRADRQRRGIGAALLGQLLVDAKTAGIDELWVPAENEDEHAIDFYRSTGGQAQAVTIFTYSG